MIWYRRALICVAEFVKDTQFQLTLYHSNRINGVNIKNNIKEIKIGRNKEIKLTRVADDTTAFLRIDDDILKLILEIKRFSKFLD